MAAAAAGLGLVAAGCSAGQITQTDQQVAAVNGAHGQVGPIAVRDAQLLFPVDQGYYREGDSAPVVVLIANNGAVETDKLLSVTADIAEGGELGGDVELEPSTAIQSGADQDDQDTRLTTSPHGSSTGSARVTTTTKASISAGLPTTTHGPNATTTTGTSGSSESSASSASSAASSAPSVTGTTTTAPSSGSSVRPTSASPTLPGKVKITLKGLKQDVRPGQTLRVTFLFEKAGQLALDVPIGASPQPRTDEPAEH